MKKLTEIISGFKKSAPTFVNTFARIKSLILNHPKPQETKEEKTETIKTPYQEVLKKNYNLYDLCPGLLDVDMNEVFDELEEGDLVYAAMPFTKEKMAEVEPSHRIRPYAVVKKTKDGFFGYPLHSGYMGTHAAHPFALSCEEYNLSRDTNIVLDRVHIIPKDHISNIIDHLNVQDQLKINMILNRNFASESRHPRFAIRKQLRENSIVCKGQTYYYIYSLNNQKASVLPLTKERTETPVNYCSELWYIDRSSRKNVVLDDSYAAAGELARNVHNKLAQYYKHQRKTREGMERNRQKRQPAKTCAMENLALAAA